MNLPILRNTTYAANQPILSADLNALQDCVVGAKHGSIWLWKSAIALLATNAAWSGLAVAFSASGGTFKGPGPDLPVGTTVTGAKARIITAAAGGGIVECDVYLVDATGTQTTFATLSPANAAPTSQIVTLTLQAAYVNGHVMADGEMLVVGGTTNAVGPYPSIAAFGFQIQRT